MIAAGFWSLSIFMNSTLNRRKWFVQQFCRCRPVSAAGNPKEKTARSPL
jgi:hypothetical protein